MDFLDKPENLIIIHNFFFFFGRGKAFQVSNNLGTNKLLEYNV